jgi:hypothetical protein
MNNHITFAQAVKMLESQNIEYRVLELNEKWKALITQYGGRLLGPFAADDAESVLWTTPAMKNEEDFAAFVKERNWNLGGERFWVNPELRFFCEAPELFDDTYTVQEQLDPGHYAISDKDGSVFLSQEVDLTDLNNGAHKKMSIKRRYVPAMNPLGYIKSLKDIDVDYCGYVQDIELKDDMPETAMYLEPWTVDQVNPTGKFITPFFGEFDFVDYYDPAEEMQKVCDGYAELEVTGDRKYKVCYRSAQTFGRMAFLKPWGDGWHLMIRNYYNDPSIPYCSEPWGDLGNRGCSVYYYNDHGPTGGFAEFEHGGATIGLDADRDHSNSTSSLWFFFGNQQDIARIMKTLLGIDYKF